MKQTNILVTCTDCLHRWYYKGKYKNSKIVSRTKYIICPNCRAAVNLDKNKAEITSNIKKLEFDTSLNKYVTKSYIPTKEGDQ